ncbi:hypothetical protein SBA1_300006 [Candidatus Sulfotelmatobacter kueseliae]|uniref:Uncharacterized protein n=1 Tax=Candidatus Sulfotelmatobacter kueseliae TaxID=2042962 RepID=A0A2U3KLE7_9BACT|nr:hypothetical protein SBA1_300006 [Candidatus Sulfotelmatobacter kueseliae]
MLGKPFCFLLVWNFLCDSVTLSWKIGTLPKSAPVPEAAVVLAWLPGSDCLGRGTALQYGSEAAQSSCSAYA